MKELSNIIFFSSKISFSHFQNISLFSSSYLILSHLPTPLLQTSGCLTFCTSTPPICLPSWVHIPLLHHLSPLMTPLLLLQSLVLMYCLLLVPHLLLTLNLPLPPPNLLPHLSSPTLLPHLSSVNLLFPQIHLLLLLIQHLPMSIL